MKSHRTILSTLLSTLLLTSIALPSAAFAGPLLSGYGGPGEGNQVILGSALIGGAGGAGGSGGGSSGTDAGTGAQGGRGGGAASPGSGGQGSGGAVGTGRGSGAAARSAAARPDLVLSRHNASRAASVGSVTLGLSGEDLWYVLLALGALAFTGFVTRRLARAPARPEGL